MPAARAYANLADDMVKRRDYARAEGYLRDGIAYCSERDLGSWRYCLRGHLARARLDQGDWSGAEEDVIPAGDAAKGFIAAAFNMPGTDYPVMQDILKQVYQKAHPRA